MSHRGSDGDHGPAQRRFRPRSQRRPTSRHDDLRSRLRSKKRTGHPSLAACPAIAHSTRRSIHHQRERSTVPTGSGHLRPIFIFFPFQKKHFFCGILFSSESPYLRAVKSNTILGLFFIYNGTLDLAILNKESNHGQNGLYYCDFDQKYTT